jgi:hypothetical protein
MRSLRARVVLIRLFWLNLAGFEDDSKRNRILYSRNSKRIRLALNSSSAEMAFPFDITITVSMAHSMQLLLIWS